MRRWIGAIVALAAAGLAAPSLAAEDARSNQSSLVNSIVTVIGPAQPESAKFSLPTARLHKARVRIEGPPFISQYAITTTRGRATVSTPDIVEGVTVLMVDEGAVTVEGTGWGRQVCAVRGQARVGVELTLDCGK